MCYSESKGGRVTPQAPLMPLFVEAVEVYATLGEICDTLRSVFGEYAPESWV